MLEPLAASARAPGGAAALVGILVTRLWQVASHLVGTFLAPGDLFAVSIRDLNGVWWLLASFHGDSNGLSTQPAMSALTEMAASKLAGHMLLVGIDANTRSIVKSALHK